MLYNELYLLNLSKDKAKSLIIDITKKILLYNEAYFTFDKPLVSDFEYDELFRTLIKLENLFPDLALSNSPSKTVGSHILDIFKKIKHNIPMLSLNNAFHIDEVRTFLTKVSNFLQISQFPTIFCEPKIDGLSFSAKFYDGKLVVVSTRGNGIYGEDITDNFLTIDNFPYELNNVPGIFEVRGEIFMNKIDFMNLNLKQLELGLQPFANPRNAAAGSIRQLNIEVTRSRLLKYFVYSLGETEKQIALTQSDLIYELDKLGFQVNNLNKLVSNESDVLNFYYDLLSTRRDLAYEIDGVVYKVNDFLFQNRMGFSTKSPRFAIAHKFPNKKIKSKILDIVIQVGRTGLITPIACLEKVNINGVNVSKASLHNFVEIKEKDIRVNDIVYVERAGDVIPKIVEVDFNSRTHNSIRFEYPKYCPSCASDLIYTNYRLVRCSNKDFCAAQNYNKFCHFVSRNALNINGLGKSNIFLLIKHNILKNLVDIFLLDNADTIKNIKNINGFGDRLIKKMLFNIEHAKTVSLERFIYSLGINNIGQNVSKILAREIISVDNLLKIIDDISVNNYNTINQLSNVINIGKKIVIELTSFLRNTKNVEMIILLSKILKITNYNPIIENNTILANKRLVFTGSLSKMSRLEAKVFAEKIGAIVTNNISKNTDFLIVSNKPGNKALEAKKLHIKILSEDDWYNILDQTYES